MPSYRFGINDAFLLFPSPGFTGNSISFCRSDYHQLKTNPLKTNYYGTTST